MSDPLPDSVSTEAIRSLVFCDHEGSRFDLAPSDHLGLTILIFYRGHWCPYCCRYLGKLQQNLDRIQTTGARLVAISSEPIENSILLKKRLNLQFPLLSDTAGDAIRLFNVKNGFASAKTLLAHPAVVILDQEQNVRFFSLDRNYKKRTTIRTILKVLENLENNVKTT